MLMMNCKGRGHKKERKKKGRKEEGKKRGRERRRRGRREGARKNGNGNLKNVQLQLPGLSRNDCALPASLVVKGMAAEARRSHKHVINHKLLVFQAGSVNTICSVFSPLSCSLVLLSAKCMP